MKKRIKYSDEPIEAEAMPDFLPPPEQLVVDDEGIKVTISLSRRSVAVPRRSNKAFRRTLDRLAPLNA